MAACGRAIWESPGSEDASFRISSWSDIIAHIIKGDLCASMGNCEGRNDDDDCGGGSWGDLARRPSRKGREISWFGCGAGSGIRSLTFAAATRPLGGSGGSLSSGV